jgi:hypothetical protein
VGLAALVGGRSAESAGDLTALLPGVKPGPFGTDETRTPYQDVST